MGIRKFRRGNTTVLMACVAAISTLVLSACGSSASEMTDVELKADIEALEARGFTEPVLRDANGGDFGGLPTYDVTLGKCTISITKGNDYWGWTYRGNRHIDALLLREHQTKLGLERCFK